MTNPIKTLFFLSAALSVACTPAKPFDPEPAQPQKTEVKDSWHPVKDSEIEFMKMFPGAAQKNIYMTWKLYENSETKATEYRVDNKPVSPEAAAAIESLMQAVDKDLMPSDGIYACRYEPNQPQFRLEFNKDGHHYFALSASNCLHAAPFNVMRDHNAAGWSLQVSGEIGVALENALKASGSSIDHIGESAAMIVIDRNARIQPENVEVTENKSPAIITNPHQYYHSIFVKDENIDSIIQQAAANAFPKRRGERLPEIACNQAQSADCSTIQARYSIRLGDNVFYHFPLKFSQDAVTVSHKDVTGHDIQTLKTFRDSVWFKTYWASLCQPAIAAYLQDSGKEKRIFRGNFDSSKPYEEELNQFYQSEAYQNADNSKGQWLDLVPADKLNDYYSDKAKWNADSFIFIPDDICPEIQVSFAQSPKTANYLKGIQKHLNHRENLEVSRGESWTLKAKDYPALVYYPEINTFWIEPKDKAQDVIDAYCHSKYMANDKNYRFEDSIVIPELSEHERTKSETQTVKRLCSAKSLKVSPNINIYFGDRNILAVFKTENGKTTIE